MKISILCSSKEHPVYSTLELWKDRHSLSHQIELVQFSTDLSGGDILLLISCSEIIKKTLRDTYKTTLIVHASNLPKGRGMSPHIWQIIEGSNSITVSLLEAEDKLDSGAIWAQRQLLLEGHELHDEINSKLFAIESELMDFAVNNFENISPAPQQKLEPTYYRKRNPDDSRLDPNKTIVEQFDLLRVSDPIRYPTFFDLRGHRYILKIEKTIMDGTH